MVENFAAETASALIIRPAERSSASLGFRCMSKAVASLAKQETGPEVDFGFTPAGAKQLNLRAHIGVRPASLERACSEPWAL